MRTPRLYVDSELGEHLDVELSVSRAHYLVNVLRFGVDRSLTVFNGSGGEYRAVLTKASKKGATISVQQFIDKDNESPIHTELAIAVSKGDRMDWIVQKATELGVTAICPLETERSGLKLNAQRWEKKLAHWREIMVNACEQCGRNCLPKIFGRHSFSGYVEQCSSPRKLILHPRSFVTQIEDRKPSGTISLLVGPEGGFSEDEVIKATSSGFACWTLGPRVLRTETAPIVALSVLQSLWGDLN